MSRSTAQALSCSIGGDQTVEIDLAEGSSQAQQLTVTVSVPYQLVQISPAQNLPTE